MGLAEGVCGVIPICKDGPASDDAILEAVENLVSWRVFEIAEMLSQLSQCPLVSPITGEPR